MNNSRSQTAGAAVMFLGSVIAATGAYLLGAETGADQCPPTFFYEWTEPEPQSNGYSPFDLPLPKQG